MRELGIKCLIRKKRYRSYKGTVGKIAPNILNRNFKADCPYYKLATDVSQISIGGQKSFLSPVIDMFNGEILSYNVADRADLEQINKILKDVLLLQTNSQRKMESYCILIKDGNTNIKIIKMP